MAKHAADSISRLLITASCRCSRRKKSQWILVEPTKIYAFFSRTFAKKKMSTNRNKKKKFPSPIMRIINA